MSEENLKDKTLREKAERHERLKQRRNERVSRNLQTSARTRMRFERQERIREKTEAKGGLETARSKVARERAAENVLGEFASKVLSERIKGSDLAEVLDISRQMVQMGPQEFKLEKNQKQEKQLGGVPVDFYCWKEGKLAVISIYAQGEPSFL